VLLACAVALAGDRDRLEALGRRGLAAPPAGGTWAGQAADAATARHTELVEEHGRLVAAVSVTAIALQTSSDDVRAVLRLLDRAEEVARQAGLAVLDDGRVVELSSGGATPDPALADVLARARERARQEVSDDLEQACRRAEQVDDVLRAVLVAASRGQPVVAGVEPGAATSLGAAMLGVALDPSPALPLAPQKRWRAYRRRHGKTPRGGAH